ncbi:MAG TPA: ribonuclease Z [Candidatus Nanoarchaeia archaeon]|nr:ribonuclease Z [Candidatus Nanoarchaeia archaeon]
MDIVFLGTSSMVPTKERNHSSVFLKYQGEGILFDCGEGTQRQLKIAGVSPTEVTKLFISHWHGDHVLGIPGLIQTLAGSNYTKELEIYGPAGTKRRMEAMFEVFVFDKKIAMKAHDVKEGVIFKNAQYAVVAARLEHGIACLGYLFKEEDRRRMIVKELKKRGIPQGPLWGKLQRGETVIFNGGKIPPDEVSNIVEGKTVAYVVDTKPCRAAVELAKNADLLICEATYADELEEKGGEYSHMTASQASDLGRRAGVKRLILTHFSQRYKTTALLKEEAQKTFPGAECAYDFMKVRV